MERENGLPITVEHARKVTGQSLAEQRERESLLLEQLKEEVGMLLPKLIEVAEEAILDAALEGKYKVVLDFSTGSLPWYQRSSMTDVLAKRGFSAVALKDGDERCRLEVSWQPTGE